MDSPQDLPQKPNPQEPPKQPEPPKKRQIKIPNIKFLESQEIIRKLEEQLGMRLLVFYTCPEVRITSEHTELFYDHLKTITKQEKIGLITISQGGDPTASLRIAHLLRDFCNELVFFVPSVCASAATILALAADKIVMTPIGYLTAIDVSITHSLNPKDTVGRPTRVSVDQVQRVIRFLNIEGPAISEDGSKEGTYRTLFKYFHPLALAELDRSSSLSEMVAYRIMKLHPESFQNNEDQMRALATKLIKDYPTHGFPILFNEAQQIGLPVEKANQETSDLLHSLAVLYDIMSLTVTTHFTPEHHHIEQVPSLVESLGKRTMRRSSYDRRLMKDWVRENDGSNWLKVIPSEDPEKPFVIKNLDVAETTPSTTQQTAPGLPVLQKADSTIPSQEVSSPPEEI